MKKQTEADYQANQEAADDAVQWLDCAGRALADIDQADERGPIIL